jgi:hypothetical protein
MSALQKVLLGTPPTAVDGDTSRVANTKANANVDVLSSQAALTSAAQLVNSAQALTAALHLGRRVNISLAPAGTVQVPAASTCSADGVILLRNIGATVATLAITTGSGDTLSLSQLNPGETALVDTDGVHAWTVVMRGRTNSDNEVVNGNCAVNGNETVAGTLAVKGIASFGSAGQATISAAGGYSGTNAVYSGNVSVTSTLSATSLVTTNRPSFGGNTAWDAGNFNPALYAPLNAPALTGTPTVNGTAWTGSQFSVKNSAATPWGISSYCINQTGGCFIGRTDASPVPLAAWFFGSNNVGTITTNGTTTTYGTTSDYRLKDGIEDLDGDLAITLIKQGRPRKYWMRADPQKRTNYGFIAHEYAPIQPEAVIGEKDAMGPPMAPGLDDGGEPIDAPDEPRYQHMDYSKPTPILWAALKRALERISALEEAAANGNAR